VKTVAEYLEHERTSETKSEFVNGEILAMSGARSVHNAISSNVLAAFGTRLRGRSGRTLTGDQRVHVAATGSYFYPDVTILSSRAEYRPGDDRSLLNPSVVVEILSPSTESYDRGIKTAHYRHTPTIGEFLLVAPESESVEHYVRTGADSWSLTEYRIGDVVPFATLGIELPVAEMFEDLEMIRDD
jgi:Uma2 family endonuclease